MAIFFKIVKSIFFTTLLSTLLFGMGEQNNKADFRAVSKSDALNVQKGKNKDFCSVCGMTLHNFYKTNFAANANGNEKQYCSIVCFVEDEMVNNQKMKNIRVIDNSTLKMIDAFKASFVVGSNKPATMSSTSIYGFGTSEAAKQFANENGGDVKTFGEVYKMVKSTQAKDMAATRERQAKAAKMGEMIYNKMCEKTDKKFSSVADAKSFLEESKICGNISDKQLQVIGLYLVQR
ncbi:MAG: nitrous oxide reductase accessory protein NosL [Arcobacteraceae bacterium]|nr:nitrous oxide reductase accessory protein NosL [Arcobacteraceae bacterium]